jgi:hypothetical protein
MIEMNTRKPIRQTRRIAERPRLNAALTLPLALLAALAVAVSTAPRAQGNSHLQAHSAGALNVTDTGHLHYVRESHGQLIDEGAATGTVPGNVRVSFDLGATVAANFTIYTHNGAIIGHGTGTLHKSKSRSDVYISFAGTLTVSHGTGHYTHAHGTGGFYGTLDRHNYAVTIQTTGTLAY